VYSNVAFLLIGASRSRWGSTPLPLDLKPLGASGCRLLVSADLVLLMSKSGGTASFTATIPNASNLVGLTFFEQGYVLDAGANALGLVVSNGGAIKLGAK
jgi:hypothetical protein